MPRMNTPRHRVLFTVCLALGVSAGCKRLLAPPLAVQSTAEGRKVALAVAQLPNLDRSLGRIGKMAEAVGAPFDVAATRDKLLTELKVPPGAEKAIALHKPLAVVFLPPAAPNQEPEVTAALGLADGNQAQQVSAAFGKPLETKSDARSFKRADGTVFWLWRKGSNVVVSTSFPALVTGATLALESLAASDDDLAVTVRPDAIAKSQGVDVKSALANLSTELEQKAAAEGQSPMVRLATKTVVNALGAKLAEVAEARLSANLDSERGGSFTLTVQPKAGSGLAAAIAKRAPYALEPALLAGDEPFLLAASSPSEVWAGAWRVLAPLLREIPDGGSLGKPIETMLASLTGAFSLAARGRDKHWEHVGVYGLAPGASAEVFLDQVVALYQAKALIQLFAAAGIKVKPTIKRDKAGAFGELRIDTAKLPREQAAAMKAMLGDTYAFALSGGPGRLLMAAGPDCRALVKRLADPGAAPPRATDLVTMALDETRGADALFYIDIMQGLRLGPLGEMMGKGMGHEVNAMPMWLSYRGGGQAVLGWRIPMMTVRNLGTLATLFMMMSAGSGDAFAP
jgi:hypothetical protein